MTARNWTSNKIEQLRVLVEARKTGSQAAEILGCSRNSAIGKAARLGLHFCSIPSPTRPKRPHPAVLLWTPEKIEELRALGAAGNSQVQAAAAMGVTEGSLRHWAEKNGIHFGRAAKPGVKAAARPGVKMPPQRLAELPPPDGSITILDLTEDRCHWPYGDPQTPTFRYCGETVKEEHRVYCPAHHAMAYQPRTPMMRRAA